MEPIKVRSGIDSLNTLLAEGYDWNLLALLFLYQFYLLNSSILKYDHDEVGGYRKWKIYSNLNLSLLLNTYFASLVPDISFSYIYMCKNLTSQLYLFDEIFKRNRNEKYG